MTSQHKTRLTSCYRHPTIPVTGFCALCLSERLASIDPATRQETDLPGRFAAAVKLRRSKSYNAEGCSASAAAAAAAASEPPRRKSCDVRARSTLWDLFNLDDERKGKDPNRTFDLGLEHLGFELREEDENESENENEDDRGEEEIRVSEPNVEDNEVAEEEIEVKTMKEFIDLEWRSKRSGGRDLKDIAGSVWEVASVFSKKLRKWGQKQKIKKHNNGGGFVEVEKRSERRPWRDTQSEIGRRSCDTEPRLSVDVARYSFDEPRASWDGYLIGKAYPRIVTPMVTVAERMSPGGSAQTKDYYSESISTSLQRRRRSFDHSNSHRKVGGAEFDELKLVSNANAKVSPESTELFYGAKLLIAEKEEGLKDTNSKCEKHDGLELVESVSRDVEVNQKGLKKLNKWRKMRRIFGLIQRRRERKCGNEEEDVGGNVGDRPFGESWQKMRRVADGEANGSVSQKLIRSYSVSCRSSGNMPGLFNNMSGAETKGNGLKRREEVMLQHNRSAGYSPNNIDNGLLRFYLTPLRSYRRSKSGKSKLRRSHSIARTVL
jgi:hypothetical protein